MNLMGLVFGIFLLLSFSFYAHLDKHFTKRTLTKTYRDHSEAERKIYNTYQSEIYQRCKGKAIKSNKPRKKKNQEPTPSKVPLYNGTCAKINLYPLLAKGEKGDYHLYSLVLTVLNHYYSPLFDAHKISSQSFLKDLIHSASKMELENQQVLLEKVEMSTPLKQKLLYQMLKGAHLADKRELPSLKESFKIEAHTDPKICLSHMNLSLISAIFPDKVAPAFFAKIHEEKGAIPSTVLLEEICKKKGKRVPPDSVLDLLGFGPASHSGVEKVFTSDATVGDVRLKKNLYIHMPKH